MGVVTTTTGGAAVLEKVFYTSMLVSDQETALDFYTNVLGLEKRVENPTPDGPRFLTVGVKGDDITSCSVRITRPADPSSRAGCRRRSNTTPRRVGSMRRSMCRRGPA
jgi:catechol 2,3-dioxygenase-like lactoylglutathione lyase family enzyme